MLIFDIRGCWSRGFCDASQRGCLSLPVSDNAPFDIDRSAQHHEQHSVALYGNTVRVQLPPEESGSLDLLNKESKRLNLQVVSSCIYDTQPDAFLPLLLHEKWKMQKLLPRFKPLPIASKPVRGTVIGTEVQHLVSLLPSRIVPFQPD